MDYKANERCGFFSLFFFLHRTVVYRRELESTVEELRGNVINKKSRVNMSDVENMALVLSKSRYVQKSCTRRECNGEIQRYTGTSRMSVCFFRPFVLSRNL